MYFFDDVLDEEKWFFILIVLEVSYWSERVEEKGIIYFLEIFKEDFIIFVKRENSVIIEI